jgi:hypothetical protein
MSWITQAAMSLGVGILKMALPMITDGLKELMKESVIKWKAYAETTPYDWDNLVVKALETLLGLDEAPCDPPVEATLAGIPGTFTINT